MKSSMKLRLAVENGDLSAVEKILQEKPNLDEQNLMGDTVLHEAAKSGNPKVVAALITAGASHGVRNNLGWSPLYRAALCGDLGSVEELIKANADPLQETKPPHFFTPLHIAAMNGHLEIAKILLDKIYQKDLDNSVYLAARKIYDDAIPVWKKSTAKDRIALETPLISACNVIKTMFDPQNKQKDKQQNAVKALNEIALTMKPKSLYEVIIAPCTFDKLAEVNKLLDEGADVNERGGVYNNTLLHEAAAAYFISDDDIKIVKRLLEKKAELNATNTFGRTPLHQAASCYKDTAIEVLIDNGADVHARDENQDTPLHRAANYNRPKAVITLLKRGAIIDAVNKEGNSPLHEAAMDNGTEETIDALIGNGADRNKKNNSGQTPLHRAVFHDRVEAVKALIKNKVDLNAKDPLGNTPLYVAVIEHKYNNNSEIIKELIAAGVNIIEQDSSRRTSLDVAAENGCLEAAKILLDKLYQQNLTCPIYLAMKKVYDDAIPLWKNGSTEDRDALTQSLLLANKVVQVMFDKPSSPADQTKAAEALNKNALTLAQGKPSTWKKFIGALTALAGVVVLALSIAGVLFSGGASLIGMYVAGSLLAAGGLTLFGRGLQRDFSKGLSAVSHVATPKLTT